jgi:hypothetical protein
MKVFEVMEYKGEFKRAKRMEIKSGCAISLDPTPESLGKFDNLEDAIKELKKHEPSCYYYEGGKAYEVVEYLIDCHEEDEDGEFLSGSDFIDAYDYKFNDEIDGIEITKKDI